MEILRGRKTYIIAALMVAIGLINGLTGDASGWTTVWGELQTILTGFGLAGLRAGIN